MRDMTGKPTLMRKMNKALIYQCLLELKTATRIEISSKIQISTTTVRALLQEMLQTGEIAALEFDQSSGGRRALRYSLNVERNRLFLLYLEKDRMVYEICDIFGDVLLEDSCKINGQSEISMTIHLLEEAKDKWDICAVGLGIPSMIEKKKGVYVGDGNYAWLMAAMEEEIRNRFDIPVLLENDLNCMALGCAKEYMQMHNDQAMTQLCMTYMHFNKSCTGAGMVIDGEVVDGNVGFAGEMGYLPLEGNQTLDQILVTCDSVDKMANLAARAIATIKDRKSVV